jgi:hypothetical protein
MANGIPEIQIFAAAVDGERPHHATAAAPPKSHNV